jgi:predicted PurR-regulated permease PerM
MGTSPGPSRFWSRGEEHISLATEKAVDHKDYVNRAVEASIHIGLVILLAATCFLILRPFVPLIAWGIIVAIAVYPRYRQLQLVLGGRGVLAAVLITLLLLALLIVPVALLAGTLIGGIQTLATHLKDGTPIIPALPAGVETWPLVGVPLKNAWSLASTNITAALRSFAPQIKAIVPGLLSASAGIGLTVLQFALSIIVAGALLANSRGAAGAGHSLANRIFGDKGLEFAQLVDSTIRSVTIGILGVALIQSVLAAIGFLVAGLPAAGLWAVVFLVAALLQVGTLVLIAAVIYVFATASATKAVIFMVWCLIVALVDNIVKPLLLGRGVAVPIAVVFLGAIGGFVAMGIIGLFVGAIVLSVGYKLFIAWLARTPAVLEET